MNYSHIIIKRTLKMTFLMKTPETKKFEFCEAFLVKKYFLLEPTRTYFHFLKASFGN
jgi:hypothetical protein